MRRALAGAVRTLVGLSDIWILVVGSGVCLVTVAAVTPLGRVRWAWFGVGAAYLVWCGLMPVVAAVRRRTRVRLAVLAPWGAAAAVAAAGATWALLRGPGTRPVAGLAGLVGAGLAGLGLVTDIVVSVVGAFGAGRRVFAPRPGMLFGKVVLLGAGVCVSLWTAGTAARASDDAMTAMLYWAVLSAGAFASLLLAPAFATHGEAAPGLPAHVPDATIGPTRRARRYRGRHGAGRS